MWVFFNFLKWLIGIERFTMECEVIGVPDGQEELLSILHPDAVPFEQFMEFARSHRAWKYMVPQIAQHAAEVFLLAAAKGEPFSLYVINARES